MSITPNLWFNGNAAEAVGFYTTVFTDSQITSTAHYPEEGLLDFQKELAGQELVVNFELGGVGMTAINAGPEFSFNPSISFLVNFDPAQRDDARTDLDELWGKLTQDGEVNMPLGEYPFSAHYGRLTDKYGVTWQLILTNPAGDPRPFVIPYLTFCGANVNRAKEAIDFYTSVFDNSSVGMIAPYEQQSGPAAAGAVMFGEFALDGQWFAAADSFGDIDAAFNEAVSFLVPCANQEEIDYYWSKLSTAGPEFEQCGWCKDEFGVSWQIVPANMGELMNKPDAYSTLMSMKKIMIDQF